MKIVIAPAYHSLHTVIADIVNGNYTAEHIYCQRRNNVERIVLDDGSRVVVKRFKQPNALNRWVYGIFRKSKARRAYEHALRLTELGVDTPTPIAYMEERRSGHFARSWFVAAYGDGTPFSELYATLREKAGEGDAEAQQQIPRLRSALMAFVCSLEDKHVLPGDFNHANILVTRNNDDWHFSLVDINRMRFNRKPTLKGTMKMLSQFCRDYQDGIDFVGVYAEQRGLDFDHCMHVFAQRRNHLLRRKHRKQLAHRMLKQ